MKWNKAEIFHIFTKVWLLIFSGVFRNKAIKALDERLQTQEKQNTEETEWPLLDEPEASEEQKPFEDQLKEPSTTSSQNLSESVTIDIESTSTPQN